jgi:hypothetical protein
MNKIENMAISEEARYYNKSFTMTEARENLSWHLNNSSGAFKTRSVLYFTYEEELNYATEIRTESLMNYDELTLLLIDQRGRLK